MPADDRGRQGEAAVRRGRAARRARAPTARGKVIAGIRPESFEDAALVGEAKDRGRPSRPTSTWSSRWARSSTPTSPSRRRACESDQLQDLAEDAGAGEVPAGRGGPGRGPPRRGQQGQARRGGGAVGGHHQAAPLRPRQRRQPDAEAATEPQRRRPPRIMWTSVSSSRGSGFSSSSRRRVDHLVVPLVGAEQQVAQAADADVGLGLGRLPDQVGLAAASRPRARTPRRNQISGDLARG